MIRIHTVLCLAILTIEACEDAGVQHNTLLLPGFSAATYYFSFYNDSEPLATGWYRLVDSQQGVARQLGTGVTYYIDPEPIVVASHFKTMSVESLPQNDTLWQVVAQLDERGRELFAKATEEHIGKDLAFLLNDSIWNEPVRIQGKITNGVIVFNKRRFSKGDAEELRRKIDAEKD